MKGNISKGVKLLASIFVGKALTVDVEPKDEAAYKLDFYDIPSYYFAHWVLNNKHIPYDRINSIYGEFLRQVEMQTVLEESRLHKIPADKFGEALREFRREAIWYFVNVIDEEYKDDDSRNEFISTEDISTFFELVAKNKIWKDKVLQQAMKDVYFYKHITDKKYMDKGIEEIEQTILTDTIDRNPTSLLDYMDERIYFTPQFEELEKMNWKKYVDPKYWHAIDNMNLTALKKNLIDPVSGQCFTPKGWQGEFLLKHKRFNYVAASRRAGKTFLGAGYLCARQLMLPGQSVIYVVPTLKNHAKPAWEDMKKYFEKFEDIKMREADLYIVNEETKSTLRFVTAERATAVRGAAANLLIFDEASFMDEEIYITATPLVRTTGGMVYCISTVNPDTPKNWFYYNLVDAEIMMNDPESNLYARRVPLTENPFISDADKADIIARESARNPERFEAEWMANFADSGSFNLKNFWIIDGSPKQVKVMSRYGIDFREETFDGELNYYDRYIISYDGAKRKDKPGLSVFGITSSQITKKEEVLAKNIVQADIICAEYIEAGDYFDHVDYIVDLWKLLKKQGKEVDILLDYGGAGVAVEEIFQRTAARYPDLVVTPIQAVGGIFEARDGYMWRVGKDLMLNKMKSFLELGRVRGFSFQHKLRMEFETYTEETGKRNNGNHWDIISSIYQALWYIDRMGYLDTSDNITTGRERFANEEFNRKDSPELMFDRQSRGNQWGTMGKFTY